MSRVNQMKNLLICFRLFIFLPVCLESSLNQLLDKENTSTHTSISDFSDGTTEDFSHGVLYLVDSKDRTFLFRGNLPEENGAFCYTNLMNTIREALYQQGVKLSDQLTLVNLSFLNHVTESEEIKIEKEWFQQHPDSGKFWHHSLFGSLINPVQLSKEIRDFTIRHHDLDGMKSLMKKIHKALESDTLGDDCIIYMHCNAGKDRTGEAAACYLMEYKGYSYKEALALDEQIAKRPLREMSINAIRWYAYYLREMKHLQSIGEID